MKRKSTILRVFALLALMLPWTLQAQNAKVSEYDGSSSTATYASIASTATAQALSDGYADVTMPFNMYFGETQVTSGSTLRIWNDGSVTFNGIAALADARIAPLYFATGYTTSTVYFSGSSQMLTVEWRKVVSGSSSYSFQLKLYPGGDIEFCYGPMTIGGSINVLVGMMSSTTDIYRVGGANNGSAWDTIYRNTSGTSTRTLSSTYAPEYNSTTGVGMVYTFTQPACVKPATATATATAWNTIKVDWTVTSPGNSFEIKYSDVADFDPDNAGQTKTVSDGTALTTNLTGLLGSTTYYIYVRKVCSGTPSGWSDMATATTPPSCYDANLPNVTNAGVVTWTSPNALVTSYNLKYGPAGFNPESAGTAVNNITALTYTIPASALEAATTYDVYLSTNCSASGLTTEWVGPVTFTTPCNPIAVTGTAPYVQDFADADIPMCWSEEVVSGSETWNFGGAAWFTYEPGYSSRLISPAFNLNTGNVYQVEFDHGEWDYMGICDSIVLFYRTSATADWVRLAEYGNHFEYGDLAHEVVVLPNISSTYQLAFLSKGMDGNSVGFANFTVRVQPNCPVPSDLAATSTGVVTWTASTNATSYDLVYGLSGFTSLDEGTLVENITGTTYTLSNLDGLTTYHVYIRAHCAATNEVSDWYGPAQFTTPCGLQTLPYSEDFSEYSGFANSSYPYYGPSIIPNCWDYSSNGTNTAQTTGSTSYFGGVGMASGTSYGSMEAYNNFLCMPIYIIGSNTTSSSYVTYHDQRGDTKIAVMPQFTEPLSSLMVSFNYKIATANSSTGHNTALELGYITNDDVTTFQTMVSYPGTASTTQTVTELQLTTLAAAAPAGARLAFKYSGTHNGTSTTSNGTNYCGIDNIYVEMIPSCFKPTAIEAVAGTGENTRSAVLSWTENNSATQWEVLYWKNGSEDSIKVLATTNPYTLNYLEMGASYGWQVRSLCSTDDQSVWSEIGSFGTAACIFTSPEEELTIGDGTSTNSYLPSYSFYNYSLTEQIYTAEEIGGAGIINSIAFNFGGYKARTVDVYLVETDKSSFSGGTDWVAVTAADKVYSGPLCPTGGTGWNTLTLTTSFAYSGNGNLLVVVDDNTGSYSSGLNAYVTNVTSKALRVYSDGTNYDPANPSSYSGAVQSVRNNIRIGINFGECLTGTCPPPTVAVTTGQSGDYATATLAFTPANEETTNLYYKYGVQGFNPATATEHAVSNNSAALNTLTGNTTYDLYVYAKCSGTAGDMVRYSFTTPFVFSCKLQQNFAATNVTYNSATVTWEQVDPTQVPEFWTVRYSDVDFDPATAAAADYTEVQVLGTAGASLNLTDLVAGYTYYIYVKATCDANLNDESPDWSAFSFNTPACVAPTAVTASDVSNSTALISWTEAGAATAWTLKYGEKGFDPDNEGTEVPCTTASYELTSLDAYTYYDVYVKSNCTANDESGWSSVCTFRTSCPDGGDIALGERTGTNNYLPYFKTYNYSLSEQIFTADELGGAANTFRSISYEVISGDAAREAQIYLGHTSLSSFSSASDAIATDGMTLVFDGDMTANIGWNTINFTTNFDYDGTSNLVVVVQRPYHNWSEGNAAAFGVVSTSTPQALYSYSDNYEITPANVTSGTNSVVSVKNNFIFGANCNTDVTCFAPASVNAVVSTAAATFNNVAVTWTARTDLRPVVNNFELVYGPAGFNPDIQGAGTIVSNLNNVFNYNITVELPVNTEFDVYVRTVCGENDYSSWTKASFTTAPSCWAPVNLALVSAPTTNSVTLSWANDENSPILADRWDVAYGVEGFNPDTVLVNIVNNTTNNTALTINNLRHSTKYEFYVRAVCSQSNKSDWSAKLTATTVCGLMTDDYLPIVESFDATAFPPTCWTTNHTAGTATSLWVRGTTTHTGSGSANLPDQQTGNKTNLVSPQIHVATANDYEVSFWIYRTNSYSTKTQEGVKVWVNSTPDTVGGTALMHIRRSYSQGEITETATGWYQYSATIPTAGDLYVVFEGISEYGNGTYIDDVVIKKIEITNNLADAGQTVNICNEFVMPDTTGGGSYHNNLNTTYVVKPAEAGKVAHISGSYELENGYDFLNVYRGAANANNLIGRYTGTGNIDYVTTSNLWADSGYFTLVLTTDADNAFDYTGFKLLVECEDPMPAPAIEETFDTLGTFTWRNNVTYTHNVVRTGLTYDANAQPVPDADLHETASYTYKNVAGVDSITYNMTLTMHPTYSLTYDAAICQRDEYTFYGNTYNATGTYTVAMQSEFGADSTGILNLQVNPAPTAAIYNGGNAVTEISGHCDNADLTLQARSNNNNATFAWDDESTAATRVVNPHETGTYTVVATNPTTGCTSLPASVTVTTTPVPALTISGDAEICYGQSATLTLADANNVEATYRWSNGATGTSITVNPTETTTYTVTATTTNASACTATAEFTVTVNQLPVVTATASVGEICRDSVVTLTATEVEGYSYSWSTGAATAVTTTAATSSMAYSVTVTDQKGCVNEFNTATVTVHPSYELNDTLKVCYTYNPYTWGDKVLSADGNYDQNFTIAHGCDSLVHLSFTFEQMGVENSNIERCFGDSYTFENITRTANADTNLFYIDNSGECPVQYNLAVTVNPVKATEIENTVCDTYTWPVSGETYTESGAYPYTLATTKNCDSVVTLNLTVNYQNTGIETVTACDSYEWDLNGVNYTASTNEPTFTLQNQWGCDSVVTLNLTVNYRSYHEDFHCVRDAYDYTWINGNTYDLNVEVADGIEHVTGTNAVGCNEIAQLHLIMNPAIDSLNWATVEACDEYEIANAVVFNDADDCEGHTEPLYLSESGDYIVRVRATDGHDQVVRIHLTINTSTYHTTIAEECLPYTWTIDDENGDPFEVATITEEMVNGANPFTMSVDLAEAGFVTANCSSIEVLRLTPKYPSSEITDVVTICANDSWIADNNTVFNGIDFESGIYTWDNSTLNEAGCPLTKQVDLTVNPVYNVDAELTFCESDFVLNEESGKYEVTVTDLEHADQTIVLTIPGALNEEVYESTAVASWQTALGCDSIVNIAYTVNPTLYQNVYAEACYEYTWALNGETYLFADGADQTAQYASEGENGCKIITVLNLTLKDTVRGYENYVRCTSYQYGGTTYRTDKTFVELYEGEDLVSNGCDSVTYINFHVQQTDLIHQYVVSNRPYTWQNGQTFEQSVENVFYDAPGEGDCGNVYSLHLTIVDPIVLCDNEFPYETGVGENNITLEDGNRVVDEASFCLDNPYAGAVGGVEHASWGVKFNANRTADWYNVFGAKLYYVGNAPGEYTMRIYSGGDNVPSTLVASKAITFDANEEAGWKYFELDEPIVSDGENLWVTFYGHNLGYPIACVNYYDESDQNGAWVSTYEDGSYWESLNQNNTTLFYSFMIKTVYSANMWRNNDPNGNDTILYYTVNKTYNTTEDVDECDSYTWEGTTYTESGLYTKTYESVDGCDSVLNLNLTIRNATTATMNVAVCDTYTWAVADGGNDSVFTVSGTHVNTITNNAGCDSVITLNLTINKNDGVEVTVNNGCDSYTWDRNNTTYTESGDYSVTFTDANGCEGDSVLHLTINPSYETNSDTVINYAGSFTYLGVMYTAPEDIVVDHLFQSVNGCDSLDHLHIVIPVIADDQIVEVAVEACGTYTWEAPDGTGHTYGWISVSERQSHGMALYKDLTDNRYVYTYPTDTTFDANGVMTQVRVLHLNLLESTTSTETLNIPVSLGSYTIEGVDYLGNPENVTLTFTYADRGTSTVLDPIGVGSVAYCNDYRTYTINYIDNYDTTEVYACAETTTYEWGTETYTLGEPGTTDWFTQKENEGTLTELVHVLKVNNRTVNAETVTETVCDTYTWTDGNEETYTETVSGVVYNYTDANGCAATKTLNLTVNHNSNTEITKDECDTYTWTAADGGNGNAYTASGDYTYNYNNATNGCPSVNTLHLTIRNNTNQTITKAECESYTWTAEDGGDGRVLTTSGTVTYEYNATNGCPSVNTLNLTINNNTNETVTKDECDTYTWTAEDGGNGQVYTASGTYTYDYNTTAGCPSTNTLNLTIRTSTSSEETLAQCDSYTWTDGDGLAHTESGVYTHTATNVAGCDSLMTLNLTINVNNTGVDDVVTECDEYTWNINDRLYTTSGSYTARTTDGNGCAATNTLTLTINHSTNYDSILYVSDGSYRYTYQDSHQELFSEGVYSLTEHYTNVAGCDSTLNITLNVGTANLIVENIVNCSEYTWRDSNTYVWISNEERNANLNDENIAPLYKTSTGTYVYYNPTYTIEHTDGYNDIYMLALTLTQSFIGYDEVTMNISDQIVNYAPIYNDDDEITGYHYSFNFDTLAVEQQDFVATDKEFELHFPAVEYCDSIITLTVHLVNNYQEVVADAADICVTTSTYEWRGHEISTATNDYDHAHTYYVYDTLATGTIEYITVNQHPVSYSTERRTACDEYTWNGTTYTESTSNATVYFPAGTVFNAGTDDEYTLICDSTVTLMLTINNNTSTEYTVAECNTYTWTAANGGNGETYTESGDYEYDYLTNKGCPSTNTLHLTINMPTSEEFTVDVCDTYTWSEEEGGDGRVLTATGEYTYSYNTTAGCASVNTLHLTIRNNSNQTVTKTVCDTYTWTAADKGNDMIYTESGVYTYEYEAENGCPSVNTLNLTVNHNSGYTDEIVACDSVKWHGTWYYADNNTAIYSYVDGNNCPSVDTLDLTINHATHNSETVVECQTYTWHNNTYNNPSSVGDMFYGTYEYMYYNEENCLSVDTLHLTLGGGRSFNTETVTNCGPYTWVVNGEEVGVLDETMETTASYTNPNTGCEHVVFLNLTILEAPETVIPVEICDNELPYVWTDDSATRTLNFTESGEATVTYPFSETCDSTVRVVLTVNPTKVTNLTDAVCLGSGYTDNGFNITAEELPTAGEYTFVDHRTTDAGCEHTYNLTLTVGDVINNPIEEVACDSYAWNAGDGVTYNFTESGTYNSEAYANVMGCTTVDVLTLTIKNNASTVYTESACFSYVWNGTEYDESGDYTYEYTDNNGCASVDTLHLTINPNTSAAYAEVACTSYDWHGITYTQSGVFYHHYNTAEGCAGIDTLTLTINAISEKTDDYTECESFTWIDGETYTASTNTPTVTLTAANGCDSIVTLNLTINNYEPTVEYVETCDVYSWNGVDYETSGIYIYNNIDDNGCKGDDTLVLTVNSYEPTVETVAACDSYTWNGNEYETSGIYTYLNSNDNGCSGVDTLVLTLNASTTSSFEAITCNTYNWNGTEYAASGVYAQTLQTVDGCDSVVTMTLTVSPAAQINVYEATCGSYTWDNDTYTASGIYTHTYTTASGCDSVVNLMLTINAPITNTVTATACDSYTWIDGITYTASTNTPSVTMTAANGCDSIVTLNLTVNNSATSTINETVCNSYTWNGATYTTSGTYNYNYLTANGCDSVVTLNLTISPAITTTISEQACSSYTWNNTNYTTSGVYNHTYTAANGCDSIVTLTLTIKNPVTSSVTATACDSYLWNGLSYTTTGSFTHTYTAANGCDSVVTLNLTVNNSATSSFSETVCGSYTWNGASYNTTGSYTHTYTTVGGCDSTVTLNLTISPAITNTISEQACNSYIWNGITYSVSGAYTYTYTAASGCDSIVTLNLTILPALVTNLTETACDVYVWDGTTYTTSGIYTNNYTSVEGCDSTVNLVLTITNSISTVIAETACDSYVWDTTTYTATGIYTETFTSANGCDSTVTLNLTIKASSTGTDSIVACESYTWIDSVTYTASTTTPTMTLTNAAGCDSVVTLKLTVNYVTYGIDEQVACDGYIWIDGNNYTESTMTPVDTVTGSNGCDSIVTLHLTINNSVEVYEEITVNSTELPYTWRGETIPGAGDYVFNAYTVNGCDSTVYLHVNVNQIGIDVVSLDDLKVYPNPTRGQVTISAEDVVKVEVLDIVGRRVATFENTNTFDLSNLAEGAYTLRITLPEGVTVRKIVKK